MSNKDFLTTLLLCIFIGIFGAHRFYVNRQGTGLLMLLTAGGFGIWWLIDLAMISSGHFKDKEEQTIKYKKRYKIISDNKGKQVNIGSIQGYGGEYQLNLISKEQAISLMKDRNAENQDISLHSLLDGGGSCDEQKFANYGPSLESLRDIFPDAEVKPFRKNVIPLPFERNILQHAYVTEGKIFSETDFIISVASKAEFDEKKLTLIYDEMIFDSVHNIDNVRIVAAIEYDDKECDIQWTDSGQDRFITLAGLDDDGNKISIFDSRKDKKANWNLMKKCFD